MSPECRKLCLVGGDDHADVTDDVGLIGGDGVLRADSQGRPGLLARSFRARDQGESESEGQPTKRLHPREAMSLTATLRR